MNILTTVDIRVINSLELSVIYSLENFLLFLYGICLILTQPYHLIFYILSNVFFLYSCLTLLDQECIILTCYLTLLFLFITTSIKTFTEAFGYHVATNFYASINHIILPKRYSALNTKTDIAFTMIIHYHCPNVQILPDNYHLLTYNRLLIKFVTVLILMRQHSYHFTNLSKGSLMVKKEAKQQH